MLVITNLLTSSKFKLISNSVICFCYLVESLFSAGWVWCWALQQRQCSFWWMHWCPKDKPDHADQWLCHLRSCPSAYWGNWFNSVWGGNLQSSIFNLQSRSQIRFFNKHRAINIWQPEIVVEGHFLHSSLLGCSCYPF